MGRAGRTKASDLRYPSIRSKKPIRRFSKLRNQPLTTHSRGVYKLLLFHCGQLTVFSNESWRRTYPHCTRVCPVNGRPLRSKMAHASLLIRPHTLGSACSSQHRVPAHSRGEAKKSYLHVSFPIANGLRESPTLQTRRLHCRGVSISIGADLTK